MKRERELAERRKNEPKLDQNQDHLVRKIFSRFRKGGSTSSGNLLSGVSIPGSANVSNGPCGSQSGTPIHSIRDVERGELSQQISCEDSIGGGGGGGGGSASIGGSPRREKVGLVKKEDETGAGSRAGSAKSKWGRMIRGGGSTSSDMAPEGGGGNSSNNDPQSLQSLLPVKPTTATTNPLTKTPTDLTATVRAQSAGSGNKIHPKLSRVPERQESLDEPQPLLDRSRIKAGQPFSTSVSADYNPSAVAGSSSSQQQMPRSESSSIIDSFTELKQEVRSEVQRINHKMSRLEDILGEILVRLTPASVAAATSPAPVLVAPPQASSVRSPGGGRMRNAQVAPAPPDSASSTSSGATTFLNLPSADAATPVVVDVDGAESDGRSSSRGRKSQVGSRNRPRSGGSGNKLTTQFQEYV